ncbi:heme-binding domain-containing protein [Allomuricauda sp. d1]|uniref:heme-binding domain-containing protein n=1 Tax=Allomuricauda sp. d1 TaxID=3136725 RepID=UPI0031D72185
MKILKIVGWVALIALVVIQFIRPDKNITENTDYVAAFEAETAPSVEVKQLLETTCYDCHSDNTTYPWYNNVAPVSFWMAHHVEEGKEHLDFSDWANYSAKKKDHKLEELIEEVEEGEMPLKEYTWTHGEAKLTEAQKKLLMDWAQEARSQYHIAQ